MKVKIDVRQKAIKEIRSQCSFVISKFRADVQTNKKAYKRLKKVKIESFDLLLLSNCIPPQSFAILCEAF